VHEETGSGKEGYDESTEEVFQTPVKSKDITERRNSMTMGFRKWITSGIRGGEPESVDYREGRTFERELLA
jgi:hypothetical protein